MTRADYKDEWKWDLSPLCSSKEDEKKFFEEISQKIDEYVLKEKSFLESAQNLYDFLSLDEEILCKLERLYVYCKLKNDEDMCDIDAQKSFENAENLFEKYLVADSSVIPKLLEKGQKEIEDYIAKDKRLEKFARYLREKFKFEGHILSEDMEGLLSNINHLFGMPEKAYSYLVSADLKFDSVKTSSGSELELSEGTYPTLLANPDRKVREEAFTKLHKGYESVKNTLATTLASSIKTDNRIANVRNYKSARAMSLYMDDIDEQIYDNLIDVVKKNAHKSKPYALLRKRVLGLEEMHSYDTCVPIVKDYERNFTLEETRKLITSSLAVLGEDYVDLVNRAFEERWLDLARNDGKYIGGYCTSCYEVHPYILLNFDGTLDSVEGVAHELGHAMQYYYISESQHYMDTEYPPFVGEVASQVNEILLCEYMIKNSKDKDEKKYLLDEFIGKFKSSVFNQTRLADFENRVHEMESRGEVLTAEVFSEEYKKVCEEYSDGEIILDEMGKYTWARLPHFYSSFYVYQYATSYIAALKIAEDILNEKEGALDNYKKFLTLGRTVSPLESLKLAGVDLNKRETLEIAFDYFEGLIKKLEKLYEE